MLKKSHPGSRLALLTDMDTQFDFDGVDDIEVSTACLRLRQVKHDRVAGSQRTRACRIRSCSLPN